MGLGGARGGGYMKTALNYNLCLCLCDNPFYINYIYIFSGIVYEVYVVIGRSSG